MTESATAPLLKQPKPWPALVGLGFCLVLALFLRWPMMTQAARHLDSDLAVDGLTLRQFVAEGRWRWHYPGTPHIGTAPLLLSLPAVAAWGEGPASLVFAGVAANLLLITGVYLLVLKTYGPTPGFFAGLMLAAGGLGQVWLSARVTGGHMLAAAWLAWAWLGWTRVIRDDRYWPWLAFGLFCGLGLWVDSIFLLALPGLGLASLAEAWTGQDMISIRTRIKQALLFIAMLPIGPFLLKLGDGVNVYGSQFELSLDINALKNHAIILLTECAPRLIFGRIEPNGRTPIKMPREYIDFNSHHEIRMIVILTLIPVFLLLVWLAVPSKTKNRPASPAEKPKSLPQAMWLGFNATLILNLLTFILNKNIFNSDNYRYLVLQLVPLGMVYGRIAFRGKLPALSRCLLIAIAALFSADVYQWQTQFGIRNLASYDKSIDQLKSYASHFTINKSLAQIMMESPLTTEALTEKGFEADYWDVYKAIYLNRLPVTVAKPFGFYPDRFPDKSPKIVRYIVVSGNSGISAQIFQMIRMEGAKLYNRFYDTEIYERPALYQMTNRPNATANSIIVVHKKSGLK